MSMWAERLGVLLLLALPMSLRAQTYFPAHSFNSKARADKFVADWYTRQLIALEEKPLFGAAPMEETYRFLWLRTFHHPVSVSLEVHADGAGILTTKMADGAGGYAPGKLIENRTTVLSREQVTDFVSKVAELRFWDLPSYDRHADLGPDGSEWVIEAAKAGSYHIASRWSPSNGPVFALGFALAFRLGNIVVPPEQLY